MKRKLTTIAALAAMAACAAFAGDPFVVRLPDVSYTTSGTVSGRTVSASVTVPGYVDEITLDVVAAGAACTGRVMVYAQPAIPSMSAVVLATNYNLSGDATIRVRFDGTGVGGVANTSDPPERYNAWGSSVYWAVTNKNHMTNVTFKAAVTGWR